jgi:hypothetical protein
MRWIGIKAETHDGYENSLEVGTGEEIEGLRVVTEWQWHSSN